MNVSELGLWISIIYMCCSQSHLQSGEGSGSIKAGTTFILNFAFVETLD